MAASGGGASEFYGPFTHSHKRECSMQQAAVGEEIVNNKHDDHDDDG